MATLDNFLIKKNSMITEKFLIDRFFESKQNFTT